MHLPGINVTAELRFCFATLHVSLHALMAVSNKNFVVNIYDHLNVRIVSLLLEEKSIRGNTSICTG
jgi:hypothetical protein